MNLLDFSDDILSLIFTSLCENYERDFLVYLSNIYSLRYTSKRLRSISPGYVKIFLNWTTKNDNIFQIRVKYNVKCITENCVRLVNPVVNMRCPFCESGITHGVELGFLIIFF